MIKAVIFDLDDTLISEKEFIRSGYKEVARSICEKHELDKKLVYDLLLDTFERDSKNVFNRVLDKLNIDYEKEDIRKLVDIYRGHKPDISLYEDAKCIIETLHGREIKLGIITDGYGVTQRNKLEVLDIDDYFEHIIVTDELGREYWKPHEKAYQVMRNKLELDYEEMVYVGDNVSKDFVTANRLGMNTVFISREEGVYTGTKTKGGYLANLEVRSLIELEKLI
ncbi:MAG: HAD-IA family hydrolase [Romboutsia sp.]